MIGRIREVKGRKVIVDIDVSVDGVSSLRGESDRPDAKCLRAFLLQAIEKANNHPPPPPPPPPPCSSEPRHEGWFG